MKQRNDDSAAIEDREEGFLAYGDNFWANRYSTGVHELPHARRPREVSPAMVLSLQFCRGGQRRLRPRPDGAEAGSAFCRLALPGEKPPPIPTNTTFAASGVYLVNKDVNQGRVAMMLPGVLRENPDYFSIVIMNDILGGGGFTSRIMSRVRSDEGLAYDAHSSFQGGIYYPRTFAAGFQSKSRTVPYAASIVLDEMKKIAAAPVTERN